MPALGEPDRSWVRVVGRDLRDVVQENLRKTVEVVRRYVNKRVAHRDIKVDPAFSWDEWEACLDKLRYHANFLARFLTSSVFPFCDDLLPGDWADPLRDGLFPSGVSGRRDWTQEYGEEWSLTMSGEGADG